MDASSSASAVARSNGTVSGGSNGSAATPAIGGSAEVTHFGKYDDTALFADESNPAAIKDPGEFKALRANS